MWCLTSRKTGPDLGWRGCVGFLSGSPDVAEVCVAGWSVHKVLLLSGTIRGGGNIKHLRGMQTHVTLVHLRRESVRKVMTGVCNVTCVL